MSQPILIKRRASGSAAAPQSLLHGELAMNEVSGVLWYGKGAGADGAATQIVAVGGDAYARLDGATFTGSVTVNGNFTVNGTTETINVTTVHVSDKNLELGVTESPTDTTADGGGITVKGATDKSLTWVASVSAWRSSEDFDLVTGKSYKINGTSVLTASTLGSGVTASSLTSVGTLVGGTWNASTIQPAYGGTGLTSAVNGLLKGDGTAYAAAVAGTDYLAPSSTVDGGAF